MTKLYSVRGFEDYTKLEDDKRTYRYSKLVVVGKDLTWQQAKEIRKAKQNEIYNLSIFPNTTPVIITMIPTV
jgi:hypothetical protein